MQTNRSYAVHTTLLRCTATMLIIAAIVGCTGGTLRHEPPDIDAQGAATLALEMYDLDGDGYIGNSELDAAPALKASMETLDADGDGKVSEDEIATRIESWQATKAGVCVVRCYLTLNGRPLEGASITFEPEEFLGDEVKTAVAYTDSLGEFSPSIPKKDRPTKDMPFGMQLGFYKIRVSKEVNGKETIPAKFNSETTLGQQVAPDDPAIIRQKIILDLESR